MADNYVGNKFATLIDPIFKVPEGAEDEFEFVERLDPEPEDTEIEDEVADGLETPDSFIIISQKLRRVKGKNAVVDIVFETDEIEGATKYEIKVTKA